MGWEFLPLIPSRGTGEQGSSHLYLAGAHKASVKEALTEWGTILQSPRRPNRANSSALSAHEKAKLVPVAQNRKCSHPRCFSVPKKSAEGEKTLCPTKCLAVCSPSKNVLQEVESPTFSETFGQSTAPAMGWLSLLRLSPIIPKRTANPTSRQQIQLQDVYFPSST